MSNWWLVHIQTQSLYALTNEAGKSEYDSNSECQWLEVPNGVAPGNCIVQNIEGVLSLISSNSKTGPRWDILRSQRNNKLSACDWTQLPDSPLSTQEKEDWATYRQALRDLPDNTSDPDSPTWPTEP
jgi:hypothetical protein